MDGLIMLAIAAVVIGAILVSWWNMLRPHIGWRRRLSESPVPATTGARLIEQIWIAGTWLSVDVHLHTLSSSGGPVSCWTYVSRGLWPLGQKEIVFTVKRRPTEADSEYPRDLLALYRTLFQFAAQKQLVDIGGISMLNPDESGLLGRQDFLGILYAPPQHFEGIRITVPSLTGLVLTRNEFDLHQQFGTVRVMAMLGERYRYFPTAPWADRDRSELCSPGEMAASFLAKPVPRAYLSAASVRKEATVVSRTELPGPGGLRDQSLLLEAGQIVLRLRPGAVNTLKDLMADLQDDTVLTLLVGPDPGMAACLSWRPGQSGPAAISLPGVVGTHVAGNFITFVPQPKTDEGGVIVEDGFAVFLRTESWRRVRMALTTGVQASISPSGDKMGLEIVWLPEAHPDFADPV